MAPGSPYSVPTGDVEALAQQQAGPLIIGAFLSTALWTPMVFQLIVYFRAKKPDPLTWRKYLVVFVVILTTACIALECNIAYWTALHSGDKAALFAVTWRNDSYLIPSIPVVLSVQIFYGWQIWGLTRKPLLAVLVWFLSVGQGACQIAAVIYGWNLETYANFSIITPLVYSWLAGTALTDISIAVILVTHLRRQRTGFQSTDDTLNRIARFFVQTSAITAACALIDLIVYASVKNNVHYIFNFPLFALYANCLIASLNARTEWFDRPRYSGHSGESDPIDSVVASNQRRRLNRKQPQWNGIQVETVQAVVTTGDKGDEREVPPEVYRLQSFQNRSHAISDIEATPAMTVSDSNESRPSPSVHDTKSEHSVDTKGVL